MLNESDLKMPEITRRKRIVLEHKTGQLAGLSQILGTTDDLPSGGSPLPDYEVVQREDRKVGCSLIRVAGGAVYYREIVAQTGGRFNEAQR